MMEEWRKTTIDDRYYVSSFGNAKSIINGKVHILHPVIDNTGYYYIRIRNKAYSIHRLVALSFIPTIDTSLHIDHIDGNKLNNNVSNLRWCTQKENNNNPITRARISKKLTGTKRTVEQRERMKAAQQKAKPMLGKKHSRETLDKFKSRKTPMLGRFGKDNPNSKPVAMIDDNGNIIRVFENSLSIQQEFGIARESISRCCSGKRKTAGGHKWKYVEKEITL